MGRPKIDPKEYNLDWEEEMLNGYTLGKSDVWIRVNCFKDHVVSDDLWYRWIEEIDIFSRTVKVGKELSQAWWENVSQGHADGTKEKANATSLIFNMCNRFKDHYQQRQVVDQTTKVSLDVDELDKLKEFLDEHGVDTEDL